MYKSAESGMHARQVGVALISVLLIVAILMAVASRLLAGHNLVISQHQNTFEQNQALHYALGAETLARQALYEDFTNTGKDSDHLEEIWAQDVLPFELDEGGYLEAQVRDLHNCMNLNNLSADNKFPYHNQFKQLLTSLSLPEAVADAWRDWVDKDQIVEGFGAEDSEYLVAQPPHRTPNVQAAHVSELGLMPGLDQEQLGQLLPHVCLLPALETKINVNTASPVVLAALDEEMGAGKMEELAAGSRQFKDYTEFLNQAGIQTSGVTPDGEDEDSNQAQNGGGQRPGGGSWQQLLDVHSEYFQLHAKAQVGETSVTLLSLLWRDPNSGRVTVLQRDFGKLFRSNVTVSTEPAS